MCKKVKKWLSYIELEDFFVSLHGFYKLDGLYSRTNMNLLDTNHPMTLQTIFNSKQYNALSINNLGGVLRSK